MTSLIQSHLRTILAFLSMSLPLGVGGAGVEAQNSEILSARPAVLRIFDREKNETTISALLIDPQSDAFRGRLGYSDRLPPDIQLHKVEYTYSGTAASRPQLIAFVLVPFDKYKTAPTFSITVEGAVLHEGEATLRQTCCVKINGSDASPQHILVSVPMDVFERLTQTKKVELKLASKRGKYSFKLNNYQRKCLTALQNTIK